MHTVNHEDQWIYHHPEGDYIIFDERGEFLHFTKGLEEARVFVQKHIEKYYRRNKIEN